MYVTLNNKIREVGAIKVIDSANCLRDVLLGYVTVEEFVREFWKDEPEVQDEIIKIISCFAKGYWDDNNPWSDELPWEDKPRSMNNKEEQIDLYDGTINEYSDLVSGINAITGESDTEELSPSGKSIRELIQKRLRLPISVYEDKEAGLYRIFASDYTKQLWFSDKEEYEHLEIFNFQRPTDYTIDIALSGDAQRMIRKGDNIQTDSIITYTLSGMKGNTVDNTQTITVTYSIKDENGNEQQFNEIHTPDSYSVSVNIFSYLAVGENTVLITALSNNGAVATKYLKIIVLELELSSDFNFNNGFNLEQTVNIDTKLKRNVTSLYTTIKVAVDNEELTDSQISIRPDTAEPTVNSTIKFKNSYISNKQHNIKIWAELQYNNATFISNVLYFTYNTNKNNTGDLDKYINVGFDLNIPLNAIKDSQLFLVGRQYEECIVKWGYFTTNTINTTVDVTWVLREYVKDSDHIISDEEFPAITANKGSIATPLSFIPKMYSNNTNSIYLIGIINNEEVIKIECSISKSSIEVSETQFYDFKLVAYGKSNTSRDEVRTSWEDIVNRIKGQFVNIEFDDNNGWFNNSFRTSGVGKYCEFLYRPLGEIEGSNIQRDGRTIEFEIESERVSSEDDVILSIGKETGKAWIKVTPTEASFIDETGNVVVKINYRYNERNKLCFIFNGNDKGVDSNKVYIVNNGIIERAASFAGKNITSNGVIKIGDSPSGIRFYNMKVYPFALTIDQSFNNFAYDSDNKLEIIERNNVLKNGVIDYDLVVNKHVTITIKGNLSRILTPNIDQFNSRTDVSIELINPYDSTKNFSIEHCLARKHGQSTLNESVTSIKFWLNKTIDAAGNEIPSSDFICKGQEALGLGKKRYKLKDDSVPANKFILQANYADSSGVNNAVIQELINQTWYNANVDGEYVLRTDPQLFTTNELVRHNNQQLGEDGWIAGYGKDKDGRDVQWKDFFNKEFPYPIRTGAASIPCVVFYIDTSSGTQVRKFLGTYVLMEDKKSDFTYGERSIYKFANDPFCLTVVNKDKDIDANRIWSNGGVLRLELLTVNNDYVGFRANVNTNDPESVITDEQTGNQMYRFERDFELIYKDPDDIEADVIKDINKGKKDESYLKFGTNSQFRKEVKPFISFFKWACDLANQEQFDREAGQHMDIWKWVGYEIFMLVFGLVDNGERNMQLKCYDKIHFAPYPWDMDIAIGKLNTGPIAYNPPITRLTRTPDGLDFAISGGNNKIWNFIDNSEYITRVVKPKVAQAIWVAGLKYGLFTKMFNDEYSGKWSERMYNISQYYKYIESTNGSINKLTYVQGSGRSYRNWWTNISSSYYNALFGIGEFKNNYIYIRINKHQNEEGSDIVSIKPITTTFFSMEEADSQTNLGTKEATRENSGVFDISSLEFTAKSRLYIYGVNMIEEIHSPSLGMYSTNIQLFGAYSDSLGAILKVLDIGAVPYEKDGKILLYINKSDFQIDSVRLDDNEIKDTLRIIKYVNLRGIKNLSSFVEYYDYDRYEADTILLAGTGLEVFTSSKTGNRYKQIELPDTTIDISFYNSTWEEFKFFSTKDIEGENNIVELYETPSADGTIYNIPATVRRLRLYGTSAQNKNSLDLVRSWIKNIEESGNNFEDYTLLMDNVRWDINNVGEENLLTYEELEKIARFNNGDNESKNIKGYVLLNTNRQNLTSSQLTNINNWFGVNAFVVGSDCLVVDSTTVYIRININFSPSQGYIIEENGEQLICLYEGNPNTVILNATKFMLNSGDSNDYQWGVVLANGSLRPSGYENCSIKKGSDDIARLIITESNKGDKYLTIRCSYGNESSDIRIKIIGKTYPETLRLTTNSNEVRPYNTGYCFYGITSGAINFTLDYDSGQYPATIKKKVIGGVDFNDITVILTNITRNKQLLNTNIYQLQKQENLTQIDDDYLAIQQSNDTDNYDTNPSISLSCENVPYDTESYNVQIIINYVSGTTKTVDIPFIVIDDSTPIVVPGTGLYTCINRMYKEITDVEKAAGYYRSDLELLTNTFDLSQTEQERNTLELIANNKSVFKYLPNITGIILDNTKVQKDGYVEEYEEGVAVDSRNIVLDNCTKLKSFSMKNCTNYSDNIEDIDLSKCIEIESIETTGSKLNIILPEMVENLVNYKLGTSSSIEIVDAPLDSDNFELEDNTELTNVVIENESTTKPYTFNILNKML